ncbi:hypothetical protein R2360_11205 [Mycobacteroides chelonae]|nr:hypothetical protein [Mycobacteroides chelonae]MEC4840085.1 hypothetical protein [Mycobacteroides chelonae]MEC4843788.1 hypothetical protein [Mycobacteroides chelonae]WED93024.1 hypothetical protein PXJ67_06055 [Mycobacteroides chelonae]WED99155.1 hypothetical protein PYW02_12400 [Mycobacteroides chelonae]
MTASECRVDGAQAARGEAALPGYQHASTNSLNRAFLPSVRE